MKKTLFSYNAIIVCIVFLYSGCTPKDEDKILDDEKCGPVKGFYVETAPIVNSIVENGRREFYFEDLNRRPEDICAEEHPSVLFVYHSKNEIAGATVMAKCYWSFYKEELLMTWSDLQQGYVADTKPGIKDAFPSGKGYLNLQIVVKFPTQGTHETDSAFLRNAIGGDVNENVHIDVNYHQVKQ
jgi:hypothetical protein